MNAEEAWDKFRTQSFQKASIQEQLDTLAAAVNEIRADTSRTAEIVPQIMGDNAAIGSANAAAGAGADDMMSGAPDMTGAAGGEDMNMNEEQMPPEAGAADPGMGEGADAAMPGAEDMSAPAGGEEMPMAEGAPEGAPGAMGGEEGPEEDYLSDEDLDRILEELYSGSGGAGESEAAEPALGAENPAVPASGGAGLAEATNNLLAALKQAAHEAVDQNNIDRVVELSHIEQQIMQTLGGEVGAVTPMEGGADAGAPVPEEQIPEDLPFDTEGAPDVSEAPADEEIDIEAESAPPAEGEDKGDDKEDKDEDKKEDKGEDKEDDKKDDDEDVKKSISADIPDEDPEAFEKDGEGCAEGTFGEEIEGVAKSVYIPPSPNFRDMMEGRVDMVTFMKGNSEGYIDEALIYKDPEVDDCCGGVDGKAAFMKADDRIATARSIFDRPMNRSGQKDPASIATAGTAQEAIEHSGEQDPDSISTADEIMDVTKSAEDIGEISASSGSTDPSSIASAGSPQEALSHEGKQDPASIATADVAIDRSCADGNEGEKKSLDISIEKSGLATPRTYSEQEVRAMLMQALGNNEAAADKILRGSGTNGKIRMTRDQVLGEIKNDVKNTRAAAGKAAARNDYDSEIDDYNPDNAEGFFNDLQAPVYDGAPQPDHSNIDVESYYSRPESQPKPVEDLIGEYEPNSYTKQYMGGEDPMMKSGIHMMTLKEAFSIAKSETRPNMASSMGADGDRPTMQSITKSARPIVKMGRGVDPMDVIKNDLEDWNLYKARSKF